MNGGTSSNLNDPQDSPNSNSSSARGKAPPPAAGVNGGQSGISSNAAKRRNSKPNNSLEGSSIKTQESAKPGGGTEGSISGDGKGLQAKQLTRQEAAVTKDDVSALCPKESDEGSLAQSKDSKQSIKVQADTEQSTGNESLNVKVFFYTVIYWVGFVGRNARR